MYGTASRWGSQWRIEIRHSGTPQGRIIELAKPSSSSWNCMNATNHAANLSNIMSAPFPSFSTE
jgi:hypothetical protein